MPKRLSYHQLEKRKFRKDGGITWFCKEVEITPETPPKCWVIISLSESEQITKSDTLIYMDTDYRISMIQFAGDSLEIETYPAPRKDFI